MKSLYIVYCSATKHIGKRNFEPENIRASLRFEEVDPWIRHGIKLVVDVVPKGFLQLRPLI